MYCLGCAGGSSLKTKGGRLIKAGAPNGRAAVLLTADAATNPVAPCCPRTQSFVLLTSSMGFPLPIRVHLVVSTLVLAVGLATNPRRCALE